MWYSASKCFFPLLQLGVSTLWEKRSVCTGVVSAKGVCSSGLDRDVCLGTAARSASAPHKEQVKEPCVGEGMASRRVGQQMLSWGLDCAVVSRRKRLRGGKVVIRGDEPEQPDVVFQGAVKDWKDHLTLQRWKICVKTLAASLSFFFFYIVFWLCLSFWFLYLLFNKDEKRPHLLLWEQPLGVLLRRTRGWPHPVCQILCLCVCVSH